jgi:hypothetical protein
MVELYHAHTDEDTKLSRHIYSNTLGVTTFSTTNVARDGRSGIDYPCEFLFIFYSKKFKKIFGLKNKIFKV